MYFSKTVTDPELGCIILRKQAGIRNIRLSVSARRGIAVTIPWLMRYRDGMDFVEKKREWIRTAVQRQKQRLDRARSEGRGMPSICDGVTIRTQGQEIVIRRSPQGTLFSADDSWDRPASGYGRLTSKRRGTLGQSAQLVSSEEIRPQVHGIIAEGGRSTGIAVTRITYPHEWGECLETGSAEERMVTEMVIRTLRKEAKEYLPERTALLASRFGFTYSGICIKNNLTNWGSCSARGNINLNLHLVRIPRRLSDYVILHELCHLREMNHGKKYHQLLAEVCGRHFPELYGPGKEFADAAELEKKLARELRKYYLW